ncbi:GNAT family N-acetyltransferase [Bacillus shivajii]|uniref:GNAT family N-acetyltransferase n=1 Tax=Bacillus shivajii TaxID=1983719 RepID=UPI001CFAFC34|nr:GNAT family N-acetyltransferase [Bacillus shivajii]UCZ52925.1 GNAT family N-acetyltransferase [Bacillus shivajii]
MSEQIEMRQLTTMEELTTMQHVEKSVWNMHPIPVHQTYTALKNGGVILGAFANEKMIGFLYSFAGFDGKEPYLCSHMLGILPEYRKGGLGVCMKLKQAEVAERMGYSKITWTFDPLESLNAYLNLHKLGAVGSYYKENNYGSMNDELNQGLPTDRIVIEWKMNGRPKRNIVFDKTKLLLDMDNGHPVTTKVFTDEFPNESNEWFIAIPANFQSMKQENIKLAKEWRYETRKVFQALYSHGYEAKDLIHDRSSQLSYYYFSKK